MLAENPNISFEEAEAALWQSWEVHRQSFGPILEPAFQENPRVRILVINALNHISHRGDFICGNGFPRWRL